MEPDPYRAARQFERMMMKAREDNAPLEPTSSWTLLGAMVYDHKNETQTWIPADDIQEQDEGDSTEEAV